ncbi:MAG: primosomal protein N' [Thermoanaerobacteraceae bacterium]
MFAEIIVEIKSGNTDKIYTYRVPEGMKVEIGMRVLVPFNRRNIEGYIIGLSDIAEYPDEKIKDIIKVLDEFCVFDKKMIKLAKWMNEYYNCYFSESLQTIMPSGLRQGEKTIKVVYSKIKKIPEGLNKKAPSQYKILKYIIDKEKENLSDLIKLTGTSYTTINNLVKKGFIEIKDIQINRYEVNNIVKTSPLLLTDEQNNAVSIISNAISKNKYEKFLIEGVTGSGKTEIYLQLIDFCIKHGKEAIVLVPEISLTPQTIERFVGRFGDMVAVMHSGLSKGERFDEWKKVKNSEVKVVVGVRNAIFAPFQNLGLIIIDEEHEGTYKQSDAKPKYNAKEVAEKRCEMEGGVLILGSATPSLESYYKTMKKEYKLIQLTKRINVKMPEIEIVNMSNELASGNNTIFSRKLYKYIKDNLEKEEQTILFLNRRGYSSFISCRDCGYVPKCPNCDISLTFHADEKNLVCHYCGYTEKMLQECPKCHSKRIRYLGIGTERVENDIKKFFPKARVLRMDVDTTRKKGSHEKIFYQFKNKEADILIGTQMISKGFDIENVTLVGVILADITLNIPDFRSNEKTFQLLTQVAGRAGRGEKKGKVVIQTYEEDHYSILYAQMQNYRKFYDEEIKYREIFKYPPFSHLMNIVISGEDEEQVILNANNVYERCQNIINKIENKSYNKILGPASAPIYKINNRYRWQIIIKSETRELLLDIYRTLNKYKFPKNIKLFVDIDPNNIM